MRGSLLVAGTTSDAGKTLITTGICRWLSRQGVRVAPYKAQNMSNNSMATSAGAEIGRAQWIQAIAAGAEPEPAMNPVLLKPGSDRRSHVVVMGKPAGDLDALSFAGARTELAQAAHAAYDDLVSRFDVVVCEGAGSPTEINLRRHDYVNMGLAQHGAMPVIVVGDIDRGGVFASMHGTLALLDRADQALVAGFVINKFRGEVSLLDPGLRALRSLTGRPVLGVVPWLAGMWLDSEDSLGVAERTHAPTDHLLGSDRTLRVCVVRLPRISNFTDLDPLAIEPGVEVRFVDTAREVAAADVVIVPGTRSTIGDLAWVRERGIDAALAARAACGMPVVGICGGFQMLGMSIHDPDGVETAGVETAGPGTVGGGSTAGLELLPVRTTFSVAKTVGLVRGRALDEDVTGYQIHHGRVAVESAGGEPAGYETAGMAPFLDGVRAGAVWGTMWHGVWESDRFRRAFLSTMADMAGRAEFKPATTTAFAAARERRLDLLADAVEEHLDTQALMDLIEHGPPRGLRFVPPGAPRL